MSTLTLDTHAQDAAHVRDVVQRSGSSFYWAMRLMPQAQREAMFATYAFCREVDDIADNPDQSVQWKTAELAVWRRRIEALFDGRPNHPITRALAGPVAQYGLTPYAFTEIIAGMEMDAKPLVAPDRAELELYCFRAAGAVGLISVKIFGQGDEAGEAAARKVGWALQITNILRDVAEDAEMGRFYLPREALHAHGIPITTPAEMAAHPNLPALCRELGAEAQQAFAKAEQAVAVCDQNAMRPSRIMMAAYRRILDRLVAGGWEDVAAPTPQAMPAKMWDKTVRLWLALRISLL